MINLLDLQPDNIGVHLRTILGTGWAREQALHLLLMGTEIGPQSGGESMNKKL